MSKPLDYAKWDHLDEYEDLSDDDDNTSSTSYGVRPGLRFGAGGLGSQPISAAAVKPREGREPVVAITVPWDTYSGTPAPGGTGA